MRPLQMQNLAQACAGEEKQTNGRDRVGVGNLPLAIVVLWRVLRLRVRLVNDPGQTICLRLDHRLSLIHI